LSNEADLAPLGQALQSLTAAVQVVPESAFLAPLCGWSARDIVAHLIGWNRHMIVASGSILRGETPAYYADTPHGYRHLNAAHAAAYPSLSKIDLLCELEASMNEFQTFVRSLPATEIENSHGVRHYSGRPATIGGIIRSLTQDYRDHMHEISRLHRGQR